MQRSFAAILLCAFLAPCLAAAQSLTLVGLDGKGVAVSAKDFADLPRASVGVAPKAYEGPTLTSVLRIVRAPSGPMLHGKPVSDYILVTGADGFTALLSLAETDPYLHKGTVILADSLAGAPLAAREGPWRLMIDGDLKPSRSVRNVVKIEVRATR